MILLPTQLNIYLRDQLILPPFQITPKYSLSRDPIKRKKQILVK